MAWAMLPGLMNLKRMSASGGMESGIELAVRVLMGGAAIRPSVGAPPPRAVSDQCADDLVEGSGWPASWWSRVPPRIRPLQMTASTQKTPAAHQ